MKIETICNEVPCDRAIAERPRYYARQMITADDLILEQEYFRDKHRRHNRLLHGWGVVCGAKVCLIVKSGSSTGSAKEYEPWKVRVKPGYILGPYGDEINLDCARIVDLRSDGVTGISGDPCVEGSDPWCVEVSDICGEGPLFVAVRYREFKSRPVRIQPVGCGCDDSRCEYSRWRDGYEIRVLRCCPDTHVNPPDLDDIASGPIPECPPCPDSPWVVLAKVEFDSDGTITKIDNCFCRRLVVSFGNFWWGCEEKHQHEPTPPEPLPGDIRIDAVKAPQRELAAGEHEVAVIGVNLDHITTVGFGDGVTVLSHKVSADKMAVAIKVEENARSGPRAMTYTDHQGKTFTFASAFVVKGKGKGPRPDKPPRTLGRGRRGGKPEDEV